MMRRLEWLGHLAWVPDHRIPKIGLFSWLPQPRPQGGTKLRWRDVIRKDLKAISVSEEKWYDEAAASRPTWRATNKGGVRLSIASDHHDAQKHLSKQIKCDECGQSFRRESDKKRHKCISERQKPVNEQRGAVV